MSSDFDTDKYCTLLAEVRPRAIDCDAERDRLLQYMERWHFAPAMTPEERQLYDLATQLIEAYESKQPDPVVQPHEMLNHFLEDRQLEQGALTEVLGSAELVADLCSGKRGISRHHARLLSGFFEVPANAFWG
jgi:antitoxin component HigA of HigAB toxin-antitoxin module